jgi:hypothetical protein
MAVDCAQMAFSELARILYSMPPKRIGMVFDLI